MSAYETSLPDAEIIARVVNPESGDLSPEVAEAFLNLDFPASDREAMKILAEKASNGELSPEDRESLDSFIRVGHFLGMLKSKARTSLQNRSSAD